MTQDPAVTAFMADLDHRLKAVFDAVLPQWVALV